MTPRAGLSSPRPSATQGGCCRVGRVPKSQSFHCPELEPGAPAWGGSLLGWGLRGSFLIVGLGGLPPGLGPRGLLPGLGAWGAPTWVRVWRVPAWVGGLRGSCLLGDSTQARNEVVGPSVPFLCSVPRGRPPSACPVTGWCPVHRLCQGWPLPQVASLFHLRNVKKRPRNKPLWFGD